MTEQELKKLFRKLIPNAYKSLQEAASMQESEAKRYKVSAALKTIDRAQEILTSCWGELRFKDELILTQRAENVPRPVTAHIFYGSAEKNDIKKIIALEDWAFKRLNRLLSAQQSAEVDLQQETNESIAERLKAREQRLKG